MKTAPISIELANNCCVDNLYADWSVDGRRLLIKWNDYLNNIQIVQVWDIPSGTSIPIPRIGEQEVSAQLNQNGQQLLLVTRNYTDGSNHVVVWQIDSGTIDEVFCCGLVWPQAQWSPDEQSIMVVAGGIIHLWDARTLEPLATMVQPSNSDYALWSPNSHYIMATDENDIIGYTTIYLWDSQTYQLLATIVEPNDFVNEAWSPDGNYIIVNYSSNDTWYTNIHYTDFEDVLRLAESRVTRDLTPEEREKYLSEPISTPAPSLAVTPTP